MTMKAAFQKAAEKAFAAAGDLRTTVTYRSKNSGSATYTPSTGAVSDSYSSYTIKVILADYTITERDGKTVLSTDRKAIIPVSKLTPTPKTNDIIVIDDVSWDVVGYKKDPADALYTIQIRKP